MGWGESWRLTVVVAIAAVFQWRRATTANTKRAMTQADELLESVPQAVPNILKAVRADSEAIEKLRLLGSRPDLPMKKQVRASLALLESDPSQADLLLDYVLEPDSDPDELLLICGELKPHASRFASDLWNSVLDPKSKPELRLRQAAALAAFAGDDPRWAEVGGMIVPIVLSANPFQQDSWTSCLPAGESSPARSTGQGVHWQRLEREAGLSHHSERLRRQQ